MTTQPDKLFKEKLAHYSKPAPQLAWSKIESNMHASNKKIVWLRMAAGFLLFTVAGVLFWSVSTKEAPQPLADNSTQVTHQPDSDSSITQSDEKDKEELKIETETPPIELKETKRDSNQNTLTKTTNNNQPTTRVVENSVAQANENKQPEFIVSENTETIAVVIPENTENSSTANETQQDKTIYITYSVAEVNEKFLRKQEPEATTEEKKSSGIQKLFTLAADIKNSETGIGELRQKKNEILALNFRDDKKGTTNK